MSWEVEVHPLHLLGQNNVHTVTRINKNTAGVCRYLPDDGGLGGAIDGRVLPGKLCGGLLLGMLA